MLFRVHFQLVLKRRRGLLWCFCFRITWTGDRILQIDDAVLTAFQNHLRKLFQVISLKIDHGLANSRYGVVILSPHFFEKKWTQYELDELLSLERDGKVLILPVWHNVTAEDIEKFSQKLIERVGIPTTSGLDIVSAAIVKKVCAYQVQNHHNQMVDVDVSTCEYHGEPIVPSWLEMQGVIGQVHTQPPSSGRPE